MSQNLPTAEGPIAEAEELGRDTFANSPRFRTWLSQGRIVDTVDEAKDHIYTESLPEPNDGEAFTESELRALRPYAFISTVADQGFRSVRESYSGTSSPFDFKESGTIFAHLVQEVPVQAVSEGEIGRTFKNHVGVILRELYDLAGQADLLSIRDILFRGPARNHEDHILGEGDIIMCELVMQWGRQ